MNKDILFEMLNTNSVSGKEIELQKKLIKHYDSNMDTYITDETGNLAHIINPESEFKVLLAGHIDEIGLVVTGFTPDGYLKVTNAGGVYPSSYLGHQVLVYTKKGTLSGAVVTTRELIKKSDISVSNITIDIGVSSKEEASNYVAIGDTITFDVQPKLMLGDKLSARALDDRIGAFIILEATKKAKELGCKIGAYAASTVGEETTKRGAYFMAARVQPNLAIIVDVTFASDYPGVNQYESGEVNLGKGPVLCMSSIINDKINDRLIEVANNNNIPYQMETFVGRTGTDADQIHFTNNGIPLALVSLPLRNMHTPAETCDLKDVEYSIDLIAKFLVELNNGINLNPFE